MIDWLIKFFRLFSQKRRKTVRFAVLGFLINLKPTKENQMLKITLPTNQFAKIQVQPQGPNWEPEPLDGPVTASVVQGDGVSVTVLPGNCLQIVPNDTPGVSVIEVAGDAAEGDEVDVIKETIEVTTIHPRAVRLNLARRVVADKSTLNPPAPVASDEGSGSAEAAALDAPIADQGSEAPVGQGAAPATT
jgi:hypothetical protein